MISSPLAGVAGEYFVAGELSRRGHIASISLRNTRGIDIHATSADAKRSITIQCKTNRNGRRYWILNDKCETFVAENHFYVFVALGADEQLPTYHVVSSRDVARKIRKDHKDYMAQRGVRVQKRKKTAMRTFKDFDGVYLNCWEILGL